MCKSPGSPGARWSGLELTDTLGEGRGLSNAYVNGSPCLVLNVNVKLTSWQQCSKCFNLEAKHVIPGVPRKATRLFETNKKN